MDSSLHGSTVAAHANAGYSIGPCLNRHGWVFGMVTGALGEVNKNVEFESVKGVDIFLRVQNLPTLSR